MTDATREDRAIGKLAHGGYRIERQDERYILTSHERVDELDTLAQLVAFAEAVYERVWTGRSITPSVYAVRRSPHPAAAGRRRLDVRPPPAAGVLC